MAEEGFDINFGIIVNTLLTGSGRSTSRDRGLTGCSTVLVGVDDLSVSVGLGDTATSGMTFFIK